MFEEIPINCRYAYARVSSKSQQDNFELKVKFILLQSFCKSSIQKEFPTQEFLEQVSLSNSKSAKLKRCIVKVFHELRDLKF